ncbi:protein singed wings 2 [Diabrotica undecimpunctata]|uniref:protein singed wings 2 n=1 Tax=Diabrotica undecimpunctata TaxID=50387 RepID=UPI003B63325C
MGVSNIVTCCFYLILQFATINTRPGDHHRNTCKYLNDTLKCHGNLHDGISYPSTVSELNLSNLTIRTLDLNIIVERFPNLKLLVVENGEVTNVVPPEADNAITELVLSNLKIKHIHRDFVRFFPFLKRLHLEKNFLSELSSRFHTGTLDELYIKNNRWNCSRDLSWAIHLNKSGVCQDLRNLTCKDKLFSAKSVLLVAQYKKTMKESCTQGCDCSLEYIAPDPITNIQYPIIMVNCSGRGLTELPSHLPHDTRILHLEHNKISNIKSLKTDPAFKQLWDLYLDNNTIESVSYLEGSYWLSHFRVFSLKGNRLAKLPSYALDNALMKNPNMPKAVRLFLGGNPWKCDCVFTPVFQELVLQKYSFQIDDLRDVKCSYMRNDENSLKPIINLSRSSVCIVSSDFSLQEGLDLLNAVLASLIIFILGKLAYDYYHFKKSGKLPWIVSRMP